MFKLKTDKKIADLKLQLQNAIILREWVDAATIASALCTTLKTDYSATFGAYTVKTFYCSAHKCCIKCRIQGGKV